MDLKQNIFDTVKECEIKLGYRKENITLYYPEESLLELLCTDKESLPMRISLFCESVQKELGKISMEELPERGRYAVTIPSMGVVYIHENVPSSPFLEKFLQRIYMPGVNLEDILDIFFNFSSEIKIEKRKEREWGIYFENADIDPYVYYVEADLTGLMYHRFTRAAYSRICNTTSKEAAE